MITMLGFLKRTHWDELIVGAGLVDWAEKRAEAWHQKKTKEWEDKSGGLEDIASRTSSSQQEEHRSWLYSLFNYYPKRLWNALTDERLTIVLAYEVGAVVAKNGMGYYRQHTTGGINTSKDVLGSLALVEHLPFIQRRIGKLLYYDNHFDMFSLNPNKPEGFLVPAMLLEEALAALPAADEYLWELRDTVIQISRAFSLSQREELLREADVRRTTPLQAYQDAILNITGLSAEERTRHLQEFVQQAGEIIKPYINSRFTGIIRPLGGVIRNSLYKAQRLIKGLADPDAPLSLYQPLDILRNLDANTISDFSRVPMLALTHFYVHARGPQY